MRTNNSLKKLLKKWLTFQSYGTLKVSGESQSGAMTISRLASSKFQKNWKISGHRGFMNIPQNFKDTMVYLSEAFARIFGPTDDHYPKIGLQPFDGDPYKRSPWSE